MTHHLSRQPGFSQTLYDQDYYQWLQQTVRSLHDHAFNQLDLDHLIEELEDMGRSEKRAIESNLRVILVHLLKWTYQPQQRCGSWRGSIVEHRIRIRNALQDSPSLKLYLSEIVAETYQDAIKIASQETGLATATVPIACEWIILQILDEDWLPN